MSYDAGTAQDEAVSYNVERVRHEAMNLLLESCGVKGTFLLVDKTSPDNLTFPYSFTYEGNRISVYFNPENATDLIRTSQRGREPRPVTGKGGFRRVVVGEVSSAVLGSIDDKLELISQKVLVRVQPDAR
ncbi:hypothetical protein ACFLYT_00700 [Nanoarchaeota archaeon]